MLNPALRRSLVVATLLLGATVAGCTPPLSIDDRSCPCGPGYACCAPVDRCLPEGEACVAPEAPPPEATASAVQVRQGGKVSVAIRHVGGAVAVVTEPSMPIHPVPIQLPPGTPVRYEVAVPHGAPLGPVALTFQTPDRKKHRRQALFAVTEITVATTGSDTSGRGTTDSPFRTLTHAASVADAGDTIRLRNNEKGYSIVTGEAPAIWLPANTTLVGDSRVATLLVSALNFRGNAVVRDLQFLARATVTEPGSRVAFINTQSSSGITVGPTGVGAVLEISQNSVLSSANWPALQVKAPSVHIRIDNDIGDSVGEIASGRGGEPAVLLEGANVRFDMTNGALKASGINALLDTGGGKFTFQSVAVSGMLTFTKASSVVEVWSSRFQMSMMAGRSGIGFSGRSLTVNGSTFWGMGVVQENPESVVVVRSSLFQEYVEPAYVLLAGRLDLGGMVDPGGNAFAGRPPRVTGRPPVALSVLAKPGLASVTCSNTLFEGELPEAASVMGPAKSRHYEIADEVPVQFF